MPLRATNKTPAISTIAGVFVFSNNPLYNPVLFFENGIQSGFHQFCGCLQVAVNLVAVGAERVHLYAVANDWFNKALRKILKYGNEGMAQLVEGYVLVDSGVLFVPCPPLAEGAVA